MATANRFATQDNRPKRWPATVVWQPTMKLKVAVHAAMPNRNELAWLEQFILLVGDGERIEVGHDIPEERYVVTCVVVVCVHQLFLLTIAPGRWSCAGLRLRCSRWQRKPVGCLHLGANSKSRWQRSSSTAHLWIQLKTLRSGIAHGVHSSTQARQRHAKCVNSGATRAT